MDEEIDVILKEIIEKDNFIFCQEIHSMIRKRGFKNIIVMFGGENGEMCFSEHDDEEIKKMTNKLNKNLELK
jgi:methylmalonyl-CoA mutase cobalamin-binding subunit